jgi:hypothetical protein
MKFANKSFVLPSVTVFKVYHSVRYAIKGTNENYDDQ